MGLEKKLELVKRNTAEIVTEQELAKLLEEKKQPIVYHGFEPSGELFHIGYIIGINKHIDFQKAGLKLKILLADFHAFLNEKGSLDEIKKTARKYALGFEALGVDVKKADLIFAFLRIPVDGAMFFLAGVIYFTVNSSWLQYKFLEDFSDVMKLALKVRMLRAKRSMTLVGREEEDPHVSQFLYPLMQAVDMKHLGVDIAFGDFAQRKMHMLAREELPSLGFKAPIAIHHEFMHGLQGGKMSSSQPKSSIIINESPSEIKKKIGGAFCPAKQIKENPVLEICKFIIFSREKELKIERDRKYGGDLHYTSYSEIEKDFACGKLHPLDLKKAVAASLEKILAPVRKKIPK